MDSSSTMLFNQLKTSKPFFLMAGPNVIESEEHVMRMANHIKAITSKLGLQLVFKSSFDKANRTSFKSFRGPGLVEGLKILEKVKVAYDIPIVTDVHESIQLVELLILFRSQPSYADSCRDWKNCQHKERPILCSFYDLIVDPRNFEWMREANCPVVADVTHSLQQPARRKLEGGGVASGGLRELIPCIARTAVAVGVDGIFMEVHDDPLRAPVDGPTQWPLHHLEELLEELIAIAGVSKGKQSFKIDLTPFRD
ncbi:2-dehydro-3-deoxyphosphooctonate aldolase 1 isoform X6 [Rhododendron vialii]|uniref:2-dehydro-3-deoxyphosphooctonate aldolase 1 isoform X6 n=1 Tax=Rhododendron vialii TaxID=182163 RepID=UPI0026602E59|nr:2-dehydro-3-deoxyphosphooctonate aldolase 1 isoform X6 [Rhododendron vialii]